MGIVVLKITKDYLENSKNSKKNSDSELLQFKGYQMLHRLGFNYIKSFITKPNGNGVFIRTDKSIVVVHSNGSDSIIIKDNNYLNYRGKYFVCNQICRDHQYGFSYTTILHGILPSLRYLNSQKNIEKHNNPTKFLRSLA